MITSPSRASRGAAVALALTGSALSLLSLTGCESIRNTFSGAPEAPLWLHHPGGALSLDMRIPISADTRRDVELYEHGKPAIDPEHRRVFIGSSDRGLYALKAADGGRLWRFETLGPVQCEPLYDPGEDVVYFGSNDGGLYKVRAVDGHLLYRFNTNAEVSRKPVLHDGTVYVTNANDTLVAINASTGRMRWHQHRTPAFGMEVAGYAGPAVFRDKVYAAFSDGVVMAYSIDDGSEQWPTVDLAAEAEQSGDVRYLDVDTTPIPARIDSGNVIFVASYSGGVFALDAENGTRAWVNDKARGVTELLLWEEAAHAPREGKGPEIPARRMLIASSGRTGLWALDVTDGHTLWRRNLPEGGITAPVPVAGALLVGTTRYGIFLFSPIEGALIDGIETGSGFAMTPAAHGNKAFVLTNGGALLGLSVLAPRARPR